MNTKSLAIGLASFLLGAAATPVASLGPGPVALWNLTTFAGDNCDGTRIHSFQGSGSQNCDILTGSVPGPPPGGPIDITTGSVLAWTTFSTYDFSFFKNEECEITGLLQQVYPVEGEQCIKLGDLAPESFNVTFVEGNLKARNSLPVETRQGPLDTWGASSFTSSDCTGDAVTNVGGDNSTTCNVVATSQSCCPTTGTFTCDCIRKISIGSLLVSSDQGSHSFTIYPGDDDCAPTGVNNPIYSVGAGDTLCITVPEATEQSYLVETE